jgi:cytochrome c biogenesis protein CcmG/thiol:disulfide interchange protein DsbE
MKIKAWQIFLPFAILTLVIVFYHGLYGNPSYIPPVIINTPASDFSAPELYEGKTIRLSDYKGKVVVLNFWASWCKECALEHPSLLEIVERYKSNPDFVMLGVNYQDKENLAKEYLRQHGNNFTHVRDFSGKVSIDYGIYGVPETFVIDQKGMIRHKSIGPIIGNTYTNLTEKIIEPLLKGEDIPASGPAGF